MKRSRHRWLGLSLFCLALALLATELPTTSAVKATSLFFSKTSSTTTPAPEETSEDGPQTETTAEGAEATNTTRKLSGIPQIDYIYDPNLPRELNGYNLSEYPFFETVPPPEMIDFKCDGLHDGFYASVVHKCQVYHHCLYGTRYDFLCANYTAFDQKTFICHFVSEVDCKNSPNYWSRNDALYKATTTTPPPTPPTTTTTTTTPRPTRPPRRRPAYAYDYYDDDYYSPRDDYDYEDRRRPRPRRPGKKKRPLADDYEDDRYERRPRPRDEAPEDDFVERRPYERRPAKRPYDRRPYDEDEDRRPGYRNRRPRPRDEEEERYRPEDEDRPRGLRDQKERPKYRPRDEFRPRDEVRPRPDRNRDEDRDATPRDEVRPRDDNRDDLRGRDEIRPRDDNRDDVRGRDEIRPRDEVRPRDEIRPRDEVRPRDEIRPRDEVRPRDEIRPRDEVRPRDKIRPRDEVRPKDDVKPRDDIRPRDERRPTREEVDKPRNSAREDRFSDSRRYRPREDRPNLKPEKNYEADETTQEEKKEVPTAIEDQSLVKPKGNALYSHPRRPPKIKRPVPANERQKYEYIPVATTKAPLRAENDDYYDYEDDETSRPSSSGKTSTVQRPKLEPVEKEKFKPTRPHYGGKGRKTKKPVEYDEYYDEPKTEKNLRNKDRKIKPLDDYYDYEDARKPEVARSKDEDITSKIRDVRPNVKVIKRPFLPSRGGSPYLPRGLQPVAGRDVSAPVNTTPKTTTTTTPSTTTTTSTTTTEKSTTLVTTERPLEDLKEEYDEEYYDEDDIEYDKPAKHDTTTVVATTEATTTTTKKSTTEKFTTTEDRAKNLANKVLRTYTDSYEAIRGKLESTLSPGDYIKPYLATSIPFLDSNYKTDNTKTDNYKTTAAPFIKDIKPKPEISKPYTATGKPSIPDISIKQNLADSLENDYDVRLNEALSPNLPVGRVPSGFVAQPDRDYTFSRFRNTIQPDPQFAASDIATYQVRKRPQVQGVSIRTPTSYYLQPQRLVYHDDAVQRYPRQLYRQFVEFY